MSAPHSRPRTAPAPEPAPTRHPLMGQARQAVVDNAPGLTTALAVAVVATLAGQRILGRGAGGAGRAPISKEVREHPVA